MQHPVTFCVGDFSAKRRSFLSKNDPKSLCLDNDDILAALKKGDKTYFVRGEMPYASMTVAEFIAFSRSLRREFPVPVRETAYYLRLFKTGISPHIRMKHLDTFEYRYVQLVAGYDLAVTDVYVNMDGLLYTHANAKRLSRFIKVLCKFFRLHIAVTDSRFVIAADKVALYTADGNIFTVPLKSFRAVKVRRRRFLADAADKGVGLEQMTVREIVAATGGIKE